VGRSNDAVRANETEVADWRWVSPDDLDAELEHDEGTFTPWFKIEWPKVRERFRHVLGS
jgi:isopentenyl-diphosphate delta-isomerase